MARITYKPKYSIDTIISNFANKSVQTSVSSFVSDNFSVNGSTIADSVNPNTVRVAVPVNLDLVAQIMVDYGDGPISTGLKQCLTIINQNVQTTNFTSGDIFGNFVIAGGTTDFRYVTNAYGSELVLANLSMTNLLPLVAAEYQNKFNAVVLNIVNDLRKGVYDYNNYLASIQSQSRQIAKIILGTYG